MTKGEGGSKISKNWWRLLWIERPLWLNIFGSLCVNFWGVYYRGGGLLREKRSSTRDRLRTSKTVDVEWSDIVREQILQVGGMLWTQLSSLLIAFHWKSSSYLEVQLRQANPDIRVGNSLQKLDLKPFFPIKNPLHILSNLNSLFRVGHSLQKSN